MTIYSTLPEAIEAEIIAPIEATQEIENAREAFDIDMIAGLVLEYDSINGREGFIVKREIDSERFWEIVFGQEI